MVAPVILALRRQRQAHWVQGQPQLHSKLLVHKKKKKKKTSGSKSTCRFLWVHRQAQIMYYVLTRINLSLTPTLHTRPQRKKFILKHVLVKSDIVRYQASPRHQHMEKYSFQHLFKAKIRLWRSYFCTKNLRHSNSYSQAQFKSKAFWWI
jgi:hypothetical protein